MTSDEYGWLERSRGHAMTSVFWVFERGAMTDDCFRIRWDRMIDLHHPLAGFWQTKCLGKRSKSP